MRFYNKLYFRFFTLFGIASSVLVIAIGVIFMLMYKRNVINEYVSVLQSDATKIAYSIEDFVVEDNASDYYDYMSSIESVLESQLVDVWVVRNYHREHRIKNRYVNVSLKYRDMSPGMKEVLKKAINNDRTVSNRGFDSIYDKDIIRCASPIHDGGGNVIGAVLLNGDYDSKVESIENGKRIILFCMIIAWLVSLVLALFFAKQLSSPISIIRKTAMKLTDRQYSVKTGLKNSGELGELAKAIDILSDKLAENERIRDEIEQGRLDFFANVSHELRTPITVIRGYTESLADGYITEPDKVSHTYDRMLTECRGIERLVGDLLTLSKMQNPDFMIDMEPISVVQIIDDITRNAKILCDNRNIAINTTTNDSYCFMMGDYDRIRQMFLVIVDNAIKFSYDNSNIDIVMKKAENLTISITDYGIGIPKEALPNIFEKFYHSKLRMNEKGSGLGLPIAKNIAAKHGGTISVTSIPDTHTTFTFEFDSIEMPDD